MEGFTQSPAGRVLVQDLVLAATAGAPDRLNSAAALLAAAAALAGQQGLSADYVLQGLASTAICSTASHPEAVSGLLGAAGQILTMRFSPDVAASLIIETVRDALALVQPVGRA